LRGVLSTLVCRTAPTAEHLDPDAHTRCDFGVWLHAPRDGFFRDHPAYDSVVVCHRQLHQLAGALCARVAAGKPVSPESFRAFTDAIEAFNRGVEALCRELWDLLNYTDPLTGMFTRVAMVTGLEHERRRIRGSGEASSLCMVDLDNFKEINDTLGHRAGDAVLKTISAQLMRNLRPYDQVFRYGGEEFVLMLPGTPPRAAVPVVERLRQVIAEGSIHVGDDVVVQVTASFGIARLDPERDIADSIDEADRAMYRAKRSGRNQVCVASST
jgi:diguanylate cyclase (GGDEF)-like protein